MEKIIISRWFDGDIFTVVLSWEISPTTTKSGVAATSFFNGHFHEDQPVDLALLFSQTNLYQRRIHKPQFANN